MVAENKKINWRFYYFWKNKTKRQINSREMKKQKTKKTKKSIGEQTRPIEIKGEGQRKLMVSSNNPNSDHQKWSHL